jgi:hypothetical protein
LGRYCRASSRAVVDFSLATGWERRGKTPCGVTGVPPKFLYRSFISALFLELVFFVFFLWSWYILTSQVWRCLYFTKQRRGVCISRQYDTSRPAAENTNHQRTSRQGHQGKNRRVSASIDHHTTGAAPSANAGTGPDARRGRGERGGGRMRDS